jgi:signal transduction histidine kinase/CheY-like chemotaxis protein
VALAAAAGRSESARAAAKVLGCEDLALFVRDSAVGAWVPAAGLPKTFHGGPLWRAFLKGCAAAGSSKVQAEVDLPVGELRRAVAISQEGVLAVLLGGQPGEELLETFREQLPLLGALLKAEHRWAAGEAQIREARLAADRALALVKALDAARAAAAGLNEQLRREQARKDEFLAMLAHELRNPLAPLLNSLALLRRLERPDEADLRRHFDIMGRQVQQLTRLVDDLLDVSRVSRGLIELRREPLALSEILETAMEAARPAVEARGHRVEFFGERSEVFVNGDRVRLTQVFANLLQNAAKYTDPGGRIGVGVVTDFGRVSVLVRDNGIGIPPDMQSRIFDLFEQVPVSLDRSQGGLGIGLTLVRTLAELHGGHVSAHSPGLGRGSTFTVSLPMVRPPQVCVAKEASVALRSDARVLVVDDNQDAADTLGEILRLMGAQTRVAGDGASALALAPVFAPDVVFLDIGLPGMDGYETARRLRTIPGLSVRIVALTGYGSADDRERSRMAGFDAHLVKPVSPEEIENVLQAVLNQRRPQSAN